MQIVGLLGYGIAALVFAVLSMLLLSSRKGLHIGTRLIAACITTALWALLLAIEPYRRVPSIGLYLAEGLHTGLWLWVLTGVARESIPRFLGITSHVLWLGSLGLNAAALLLERLAFLGAGSAKKLFLMSGLVLALVGLVLLEQLYRNATQTARRALKYFVAAVGLVFTYDLFLYAQGQLLNGIVTETWVARGFVVALSAPLLALAVRRNTDWLLSLFVSRQVVFHTATLMAVGSYLLLMAIGGYYVRLVGAHWATPAQLIFFTGAGLILLWLLLSTAVRRQVKVFISKHFFSNKYDYRAQWLRFIETLSNGAQDDAQRTAVQAVAQIFDSPGGVLYLADDTGRYFSPVAAWPMRLDDLPAWQNIDAHDELIELLSKRQWIVDLVEYQRNAELYHNCRVPEWLVNEPNLRIISPILELGNLMGFFALYAPPAPFDLTYEDRDLLKTVGCHVATQLAQYRADRKLAENRQFEAFNRLAAFTMHDLKNSIAQLRLAVRNAEQHKRNPEFVDDVIATVGNVAERMTRLMEQLQRGDTSMDRDRLDLGQVVSVAVARCQDRLPIPEFENVASPCMINADRERLVTVVEHLLRNAQDATPSDGKITIRLAAKHRTGELVIEDTRCGMDAEFVRQRLFRPFDSTKGAKGMGIGVYQAREYVRRIGGDMEVSSTPGRGTIFSIMLPCLESVTDAGFPSVAKAGV